MQPLELARKFAARGNLRVSAERTPARIERGGGFVLRVLSAGRQVRFSMEARKAESEKENQKDVHLLVVRLRAGLNLRISERPREKSPGA